jgi:predicted Zn-dependent protease
VGLFSVAQRYETQRMQMHLSADSWRMLGVAGIDLYIPILTFVFGEAQIGGP